MDKDPKDRLAQELLYVIYYEMIYNPFSQLNLIEECIEGQDEEITWKQITSRINVLLKAEHGILDFDGKETPFTSDTCISCGLETSTPCHSINTSDLTAIKNSLPHEGTSRGKGHDPNKRSDKEKEG